MVGLQESWEIENIFWLDGYTTYFEPARPSVGGRSKGGLITLISLKVVGNHCKLTQGQ